MKTIIKLLKLHVKYNKPFGAPFSACIKYKDNLIVASNSVKSLEDPTAHAEVEVIRQVCKRFHTTDLTGAVLISSGEPCPLCLSACAWSGIKEIYYIDDYKVANKKGYKFDQSAEKVNKQLKLGLIIKRIKL
jgi:guanine deaminase